MYCGQRLTTATEGLIGARELGLIGEPLDLTLGRALQALAID